MATAHENELLTRTGPGTPMGALMREYWIPAVMSTELVIDAPPMRLLLLGEQLIAFRDSNGRAGIMDHRCPHRCASLFFGRNEQGGIRCAYHGWKFGADGACLDMPNVPAHLGHPEKVRSAAYPTFEQNGLIWTYMGSRDVPPPPPEIEPALMPPDEINLMFVQRECNWLQALEGDIDTSHFAFLHAGLVDVDDVPEDNPAKYNLTDRAPEYHVAETDWGTMYAAYRDADPGNRYYRFSHFMFPFWAMPPDGDLKRHIVARAFVPMDDTHIMMVNLSWRGNAEGLRTNRAGEPLPGMTGGLGIRFLPNATDWHGRWRLAANASNDYEIDRNAQQSSIFSGMNGILIQDQAATESMGAIVDRTREHLGVSDTMIARTRRRLIVASRSYTESGATPPGVDDPGLFCAARSGDFIAPENTDWLEAYADQVRNAVNPTGKLHAHS